MSHMNYQPLMNIYFPKSWMNEQFKTNNISDSLLKNDKLIMLHILIDIPVETSLSYQKYTIFRMNIYSVIGDRRVLRTICYK